MLALNCLSEAFSLEKALTYDVVVKFRSWRASVGSERWGPVALLVDMLATGMVAASVVKAVHAMGMSMRIIIINMFYYRQTRANRRIRSPWVASVCRPQQLHPPSTIQVAYHEQRATTTAERKKEIHIYNINQKDEDPPRCNFKSHPILSHFVSILRAKYEMWICSTRSRVISFLEGDPLSCSLF